MMLYDNIEVVHQHQVVVAWIQLRKTKKWKEPKMNSQLTTRKQWTVFAEILITRKLIFVAMVITMIMVIILLIIKIIKV